MPKLGKSSGKCGTSGKILDYHYTETKKVQTKKYSEEQISIIKSMSNEKKTNKVIFKELDKKYGIKISLTTYYKIIKDEYI